MAVIFTMTSVMAMYKITSGVSPPNHLLEHSIFHAAAPLSPPQLNTSSHFITSSAINHISMMASAGCIAVILLHCWLHCCHNAICKCQAQCSKYLDLADLCKHEVLLQSTGDTPANGPLLAALLSYCYMQLSSTAFQGYEPG